MAENDAANPDKRPALGQPSLGAPETSVGRQAALGVSLGMPVPAGTKGPAVEREPDHGRSVELDGGKAVLGEADVDGSTVAGDGEAPPVDGGDPAEAAKEGDEVAAEVALPEFDATKPEVIEAYGKAYLKDDGKTFNMAALSADWNKNAKVDDKTGGLVGSLSEGTYAFLETKGIDRDTVKQVEAAQVAKITLDRQVVFTKAGGEEKYNAALQWAREKGYNDAAKAKFNTDLDAGGAARDDAIDLLMQRYTRANPAPRRASPAHTAANAGNPPGGQGGNGGVKPYDSYGEYQADIRKARAEGDEKLLADTRRRFAASANQPWRSGGKQ